MPLIADNKKTSLGYSERGEKHRPKCSNTPQKKTKKDSSRHYGWRLVLLAGVNPLPPNPPHPHDEDAVRSSATWLILPMSLHI